MLFLGSMRQEEQVDTFVDGVFETTNTALEGDYIILGTRGSGLAKGALRIVTASFGQCDLNMFVGEEYVVRSDVAPDKVDLEQGPNSIPAEIDGASEFHGLGDGSLPAA